MRRSFCRRRCGLTLRASMPTAGSRTIWGMRLADPVVATRLLDTWGLMLDECYDAPERSLHPVFVALQETIRECNPPRQLFLDLLHAFRMDQVKTHVSRAGRSCWSTRIILRIRWAAGALGVRVSRGVAGVALGQGLHGAAAGELLAGCGGGCRAREAISSGRCDGPVWSG